MNSSCCPPPLTFPSDTNNVIDELRLLPTFFWFKPTKARTTALSDLQSHLASEGNLGSIVSHVTMIQLPTTRRLAPMRAQRCAIFRRV